MPVNLTRCGKARRAAPCPLPSTYAALLLAAALGVENGHAQHVPELPSANCPRFEHPVANQPDFLPIFIASVSVRDDGSIAAGTTLYTNGDAQFEAEASRAIERCRYELPNPAMATALGPRIMLLRALPTEPLALPYAPTCTPGPGDYPVMSRRMNEEGRVHLRFRHTETGVVYHAEVRASRSDRLSVASLRVLARCSVPAFQASGSRHANVLRDVAYEWRLK